MPPCAPRAPRHARRLSRAPSPLTASGRQRPFFPGFAVYCKPCTQRGRGVGGSAPKVPLWAGAGTPGRMPHAWPAAFQAQAGPPGAGMGRRGPARAGSGGRARCLAACAAHAYTARSRPRPFPPKKICPRLKPCPGPTQQHIQQHMQQHIQQHIQQHLKSL